MSPETLEPRSAEHKPAARATDSAQPEALAAFKAEAFAGVARDAHSRHYWASLGELQGQPEFATWVAREFPEGASTLDGVDRRRFLQLAGASVALAGAQSCRWEKTTLLPFAEHPEERIPGVPEYFATGFELSGVVQPLLMTAYEGRPVKVEGNAWHAESQGGATTIAQAAILDQYDPDRSQSFLRDGAPVALEGFDATFGGLRQKYLENGGAGLAVLLRPTSSPAIEAQLARLAEALPQARFVRYDAVARHNEAEGARLAYGRPLRIHYRLADALTVVAFDSDLLDGHPGALRHARDFAKRRKPESGVEMSRLYAIEARFTTTGSSADHRLPVRSSQIGALLCALEAKLAQRGLPPVSGFGSANPLPSGELIAEPRIARFLDALADELMTRRNQSALAIGPEHAPELHALVLRLNAALGNLGRTVLLTEEPLAAAAEQSGPAALAGLVQALNAGQVETLVVLEGNPVYDAPRGLDFAAAYAKAQNRVHVGLYVDESALASTWHVPAASFLESWGDGRAWDGSYCVTQPIIQPLYGGKSTLEFLGFLANGQWQSGRELVAQAFAGLAGDGAAEGAWARCLHDGWHAGSELRPVSPNPRSLAPLAIDPAALTTALPANGSFELTLHRDIKLHDGRFANNGWLQELPDFLTKVTWDNPLLVSPATARSLGITTGDLVEVSLGNRRLEVAAYVMPGQGAGALSLALGYGRAAAGHVGGLFRDATPTVGFDAYALTEQAATGVFSGVSVRKLGGTYPLACTQEHHQIETNGRLERDGGEADPKVAMTVEDPAKWHHEEGGEGHGDHDHDHDHDHEHAADGHTHAEKAAPKFAFGKPSRVSELIREATVGQYAGIQTDLATLRQKQAEHPEESHAGGHYVEPNPFKRVPGPELLPLWTERSQEGNKWGLAIDLSACTGCNACVVACQAENNIPVVGKDQVRRGREMSWIRIDRYFAGQEDAPEVRSQPMACIQCENAPCEQVCPVAATVHSTEGLNDMVYNRCIGTRYCSNNCPVKVRRFNFFNYHKELKREENDVRKLGYNPEVTIRARGVMEKCTYCVQRIQAVKIQAKVEKRAMLDGEIKTACQQTCPSDAIRFGNLADANSEVSKLHATDRAYELLAFLRIKPRTAFLARITNPNPALA
jgi:molybdopterin-containing oxidoreductase family iron-sulfur binding subunit